MAFLCDNCGQPALETDTICWHCGQKLSQPAPKPKPKKVSTAPAVEEEAVAAVLALTPLAVYASLTIVIVMSLFVVMNALGQQPQVVPSLASSLKPGWTAVTNQTRNFTLNLPTQWLILDRFDETEEADFIALVAQNKQYQDALNPYAEMANDRQLLLIAVANETDVDTAVPPFVLVTRSQELSRLSLEQMAEQLGREPAGITLHRSNLIAGLNGREQTIHILTLPFVNQPLRCQHLFYNDTPDSYVVIGCATEADYGNYTNIFHDILVSFQPLLK